MDDDPDFEIVFHNEPLTKMFQQKGLKELHELLDRRLFVNEDLVKPISLRQVACNRYSDAILSQIYKMDLSLDIDKEAKTASTIIKNTNTGLTDSRPTEADHLLAERDLLQRPQVRHAQSARHHQAGEPARDYRELQDPQANLREHWAGFHWTLPVNQLPLRYNDSQDTIARLLR